MSTSARIAILWAAVLAAAACDDAVVDPPGPDPAGPALLVQERGSAVLLVQNLIPAVTMDALYEGAVAIDVEGCLRLDTPGSPTAVWPLGYDAVVQGGDITIVDHAGAPVGTVGGTFSLAGGEVTALTDALGFDADDRARADERCPGRYWIVAP